MGAFQVEKRQSNSNEGFSETLKYYVMHQANVLTNHNKFYVIELQKHSDGRYRLFTHYGRLGISNIYEVRQFVEGKPCYDQAVAEKEFEAIHKKKLSGKSVVDPDTGERVKEAYVDIDVVSPDVGSENIRGKSEVKKVSFVKATIDTSSYSPQISTLLDQLISENIHSITSHSSITYSVDGGFSTPLGVVTKEHCNKAKVYLDQINEKMGTKGYLDPEEPEIKKIHNMYFSLVPHTFGRKIASDDMVSTADKLQLEYDLIDQLSTAVQMGKALSGTTNQRMSALGTEIEVLYNPNDIKRLKKYIKESKASNHRHEDVWGFNVKTIYKIKIPEERNRFEVHGRKLGNIRELFHGSANCNILSLMKTGMKQTSINSPGVTGKMFGELGLYFSDMSTKSLRYSLGYWGAKRSRCNNTFLFVSDVALGKTFEMRNGTYSFRGAKPGYDSTSAYAHPGFLYNNEYITYNVGHNTFTYLVEMTPDGR